ncbi:uncharacterized protein LOC128201752 [Galleria mellonella]|uniref:Uncharacterized protein LOC128201752 n=1 Tax=Galleria mellonella TaxID=7137 RepID=A0ABM3MW51_GALME|nr:uncharacterized protein LOC128201752 [Galleria mellonella]
MVRHMSRGYTLSGTAHLQISNNSFNPVTTTDTQYLRPILKESNVANNFDVCTSPARASSSATKIKPVSSTINKTPSDIALLAEAITSLSKESQHNIKFGDGRLPFFDGKPLDWLTFKRVYDNTKSRHSDSDNLTRINMALRGEAHNAVAVLLVSAQDSTQVIQALATRFGRPELIVLQEVAMMRSLPKVNIDCSDLHKFACRVRNSVEVMKLLEQRCYLESPELFQSILSKLTPLLRTRWADFAASHFHQEVTRLELLASFLTQEVDLQLKHHKLLHIAHVVESEVEHGESSSTPQSGELEGSDESSCKQTTDFIAHANFNKTDLLENLIKNYYKLDSIGITKKEPRSADNERAIEILERTANRLPCGRFEVGLLWKSNNPVIPNSYPLALSRFLSLEKKMISDPTYAERYKQNIHDLVTKDYAEKCQNEPSSNSVCWFLPHFGIINPNKPAKLRVVHDAAAKIKGVSLNSLLLTGPDLLQSLLDILLRFREGKVAMTADIKEMFPRFKIIEHDRDAQKFLWRDSPTEPIQSYRMSSMIFGAVSSPFTAIYMKNKNALEFKDQYPDAVHGIIYDTYMDDYIGSVDSSDEAAQLAADIVNIHARAGLEMRGWVSNDPKALRLLPNHLLSESVSNINLNLANFPSSTPCVRALGLYWHPSSDLIGFNTSIKSKQETLPSSLTKRIILSLIMRVFDPLGILAPVVIRGRILFQNVWRMNLDWDTELPPSERIAWKEWFQDLIITAEIKIPRCYNFHRLKPNQIELHVFADASAQAYAAVAYWRFVYPNGDVQLTLIYSKSRVAPLKPSSIPRLELQAALIAARLATTIVEAVKFKPLKRTFWCDSMNVLGWLRNDARSYKTFVAHRVGEIIELSDVSEWHWVPTAYNVADDSTRLRRGPLTSDSRWIKGPEFLLTSDWPKEPTVSHNQTIHTNAPETHIHLINEIESNIPISADAQRFSSWTRLIHATAYAHRYLSLLRLTSLRKKGLNIELIHKVEGHIFSFRPLSNSNVDRQRNTIRSTLTAEDLHLAEIHVLRKSQLDSFSQDIKCMQNGLPVSHRSRLSKLPAIIDKNSVLRLSTRIVAVSGIQEDTKYPILLDGKNPAVRLLVLR